MKIEIITLLIRLAIVVLTGIIIPVIRKWINEKTDNERLEAVKDWARTVVWAAEQIYRKASESDPDGKLRKKYAMRMISSFAMSKGLVLTDEQISVMVEAAVGELNTINSADVADIEGE